MYPSVGWRRKRAHEPFQQTEDAGDEMIRSLFARAMGRDFEKLHPAAQERHSFDSSSGRYSIAEGVMDRVWSGSRVMAPFLHLGAQRNIMFAESGLNVPFRMESWAYVDSHGRETLTLARTFGLKRPRRFDEYVVAVPGAGSLIIYVGSHQHLAAVIDVSLGPRGGVAFRTGKQRLLTPIGGIRFPLLLSGEAQVEEWYDPGLGKFRIEGRVQNRIFRDIFGFSGSYESRLETVPKSGVPSGVKPIKEDARW